MNTYDLDEIFEMLNFEEEQEIENSDVCKYRKKEFVTQKNIDHFTFSDRSLRVSVENFEESKEYDEFRRECLRNLREIPYCSMSWQPVELYIDADRDYSNGGFVLTASLYCKYCNKS